MLEARAIRPDGLTHIAAWLVDIETMERCRVTIDWDGAANQLLACIAADDDLEDTTWVMESASGDLQRLLAQCLEAVILYGIAMDRIRSYPSSIAGLIRHAAENPTTTDLHRLRGVLMGLVRLEHMQMLAEAQLALDDIEKFQPLSQLLADLQAHLARSAA